MNVQPRYHVQHQRRGKHKAKQEALKMIRKKTFSPGLLCLIAGNHMVAQALNAFCYLLFGFTCLQLETYIAANEIHFYLLQTLFLKIFING